MPPFYLHATTACSKAFASGKARGPPCLRVTAPSVCVDPRVGCSVEGVSSFLADGDLSVGIVIQGSRQGVATMITLLVDGTFADPQPMVYLTAGSAVSDNSTAVPDEVRKSAHYVRGMFF